MEKNEQPHELLPQQQGPWKKWLLATILTILAVIYLIFQAFNSYKPPREIGWNELRSNLFAHKAIDKIVIVNNEIAEIYVKKKLASDSLYKEVFKPLYGKELNPGPHFIMHIGTPEVFEQRLNNDRQQFPFIAEIPVSYEQRTSLFWSIVRLIITMLLVFALWRFFSRIATGINPAKGISSAFNFGKSTANLVTPQQNKVTFADVAGIKEAALEVQEVVDFLKTPEQYTKLGAKIPKGIILVGPPGTGKTLLAKAVAGEAGVPFFSISGAEFVEMFVGVGASRVRDLFRQADSKAPCVIFIDEIDAVGRSRGKGGFFNGSNDERESTLNQLLTEMDGFGTNSGVIVLAATNRADMLDPALLRHGRFDRHIYLELPDIREREEIFNVHLRPLVLDDKMDVSFLASQTPGFSGADIAAICNEAALIAARKKKNKINLSDFSEAIDRTVAGLEKKSKIISPEEKRIIAFHEAGHAVVSWLLKNVDPLTKVSIVPRGKSLGAAWYLPEEKQLRTETAFSEHLCASLGGRAAAWVMMIQ